MENYRFSDDLDFTLLEKLDKDEIKYHLVKAIEKARIQSGVDFSADISVDEINNGFKSAIYFRILRRTGSPLKIKIDITDNNNEIVVLPIETRKIIHNYSDEFNGHAKIYSLDEIFIEKIRSLYQRTRPRDLYDIWYLNSLNLKIDSEVLDKKFNFKNITKDLNELTRRRDDFSNAWDASLSHQIDNLPKFESVYRVVIDLLRTI